VSLRRAIRSSNQPRSAGDLRRRVVRRVLHHHFPLGLACVAVLVLFMTLPGFDSSKYTQGDIFSSTFPRDFPAGQSGRMQHGRGQRPQRGAGGHHIPKEVLERIPEQHRSQIPGLSPTSEEVHDRSFVRRLTTATGYVALALLALTLLIGPANLLLRRRNPVSSYLRRDVGAWTALFSGVHVIVSLTVHGSGQIRHFLNFFVADGSPLRNSFGLGNWTGLAALVIVAVLLALSSDAALRKLKARNWKRLQRLNYALFALVIVHAFFYGALLRETSPYTILLGLGVIAVVVGQGVGIWLFRRRHSRRSAEPASAGLRLQEGGS
jgi:sulfoxide reductase heme-binding subunit YedZ